MVGITSESGWDGLEGRALQHRFAGTAPPNEAAKGPCRRMVDVILRRSACDETGLALAVGTRFLATPGLRDAVMAVTR